MAITRTVHRARWAAWLVIGLVMAAPALPGCAPGDVPADHAATEAGEDDAIAHEEEHAEEHGASATNPMTIDPDLAIFTAIVFLLLLLVLAKFAWRPISDGLTRREQAVARQIEEARLNNERAAELLQQHEAKLAAAADEVRQMLAEARRDADANKERILAEAQSQAQRQTQKAVEDIRLAKESALREIAEQSINTGVQLASQLVRHEITPERHAQLIQDALKKFPSKN